MACRRKIKIQLVTIGLLMLVANGLSLNCYQCTSVVSWEDCKMNLINVTCPIGKLNNCVSTYANMTKDDKVSYIFARGCAKLCDPNKNPLCSQRGVTCQVSCCEGELCNRDIKYAESTHASWPATHIPIMRGFSGSERRAAGTYILITGVCFLFYCILD